MSGEQNTQDKAFIGLTILEATLESNVDVLTEIKSLYSREEITTALVAAGFILAAEGNITTSEAVIEKLREARMNLLRASR